MRIIFISHSTSLDNERGLASGHNDVDLSAKGLEQAREVGERYRDTELAAIYCSDLQRAWKTAEIAFSYRGIPILKDARLRECDYGDLTQQPMETIKAMRTQAVETPFPNGESYRQTCARIEDILAELKLRHMKDDTVLIVGHRATQYGLEHLLNNVPLEQVVTAPWQWQPGWQYRLD